MHSTYAYHCWALGLLASCSLKVRDIAVISCCENVAFYRALGSIEAEVKHQSPELQKKAKQAAYLQSKSKEYKKHIQHSQVFLNTLFIQLNF